MYSNMYLILNAGVLQLKKILRKKKLEEKNIYILAKRVMKRRLTTHTKK